MDCSLDEEGNAAGLIRKMGASSASSENGGAGSWSSGPGEVAEGGAARWRTRAAWEAELAAELAAGEGPVMEAIDSYIRCDLGAGAHHAALGLHLCERTLAGA